MILIMTHFLFYFVWGIDKNTLTLDQCCLAPENYQKMIILSLDYNYPNKQ